LFQNDSNQNTCWPSTPKPHKVVLANPTSAYRRSPHHTHSSVQNHIRHN
jgi:hypothetical protein